MDRRHVRIGVFSGLLLLLYLPVLIWSPPWGENGYYINQHGFSLTSNYYFYRKDGRLTLYHLRNNSSFIANEWPLGPKKLTEKQIEDGIVIFSKRVTLWHQTPTGSNEIKIKPIFKKTSNPFTLWHIKWLEWTN